MHHPSLPGSLFSLGQAFCRGPTLQLQPPSQSASWVSPLLGEVSRQALHPQTEFISSAAAGHPLTTDLRVSLQVVPDMAGQCSVHTHELHYRTQPCIPTQVRVYFPCTKRHDASPSRHIRETQSPLRPQSSQTRPSSTQTHRAPRVCTPSPCNRWGLAYAYRRTLWGCRRGRGPRSE